MLFAVSMRRGRLCEVLDIYSFRLRSDPITVITGNFPAWVEELPRKW